MPETMVNWWGSMSSSTKASTNALSMLKFPHPGHHAGVCPLYSSDVGIEFSEQFFQGKGSAVILIDPCMKLISLFSPHKAGKLPCGVIFYADCELSISQYIKIPEILTRGKRIDFAEVKHC